MALDNKKMAGGRWGDSQPYVADADDDFAADSAGVPPAFPDNKTSFGGRLGDTPPYAPAGDDGGANDFSADTAGVPSDGGPNTQTDLDMALAPNMFPRQTGHDSLTEENAELS